MGNRKVVWEEGSREASPYPDLWGLRDSEYLLVECKSEVLLTRAEIHKAETGQMNNACAWFAQHYPGATAKRIMIVPTNRVAKEAGFTEEVQIMRQQELSKLKTNARAFVAEFKDQEFKNLSEKKVQELLNLHRLSVDALLEDYSQKIRT